MGNGEFHADEIRQLLAKLDAELQREGKAATIFIVGGAAMALAYNGTRATDDIDGTFEPRDVVLAAAAKVADGWPGLHKNWLSDGVSQLMPPMADDHPRSETIGPALMVSIASPEYVLAMKAMVSRRSQGDLDDAVTLCGLVGITTLRSARSARNQIFRQPPFRCTGVVLRADHRLALTCPAVGHAGYRPPMSSGTSTAFSWRKSNGTRSRVRSWVAASTTGAARPSW